MNYIMKRILLVTASLLSFPILAFASTASQDTTLVLPSDSSTYTLQSGGSFTTLTIGGSNITFVLTAGQSFTLVSTSKVNLKNDQNIKVECNTNDSRLIVSNPTGSSNLTIVITPSGTCSGTTISDSGSGSSGGGGGGGGGGTSVTTTPSTSTSPTPTVPTTSATPAPFVMPATPAVSVISPVVLTKGLTMGSQGADVTSLQRFLASDSAVYPEGTVSGYFGPKTLAAVKRFQEKYGIAKKGDVGYGVLGPKTRAKVKELSSQRTAPVPVKAPTSQAPTIESLQLQLKALQDMLKSLQKK